MECPVRARENAAVLLDYCAGKLDPPAAAVLERHLEQCEACRGWLKDQQAVWTALEAWEAAPVSLDFDRRLYRRIEQEQRPAWRRLAWRPAFSLALASLVVLAALLIRPPKPVDRPHQAQVETLDADRLERTLDDMEMLRQLSAAPSAEPHAM